MTPDSTPETAIETRSLRRTYKSYEKPEGILASIRGFWERKYTEKIALAATDLKIFKGQIVGLVGSNGAGKTTLLKILSGLIHPTDGDAQVLGYRPWERKNEFLRQMSILLGQKNQLWWDLSPLDSYSMLAEIYDLDRKKAKQQVQHLSEIMQCESVLKTQLRRLSLGERMKMEIIGALLHQPQILFLDEPTIGLDIVAQTAIRQFLTEYAKQHKPTIILTSHYMDDIAKLSDRLLLISKGHLVYDGSVQAFTKSADKKQKVSFHLTDPLTVEFKIQLPSPQTGENQELTLAAHCLEHSLEIATELLPIALAQITRIHGIQDLKIEEADFEEIIHRFLEKESRVLSTGHYIKS